MEMRLMATLAYVFRRTLAIALGLALTGYSAWASWTHQGDLIGPLAAISAAALLAFSEYAWRDRHMVHFGMLGILGIVAAVISGSVVLERVSHTQEARAHAARSMNLPRQEAERSLAEAKAELANAAAAANRECSSGRGRRCDALEKREAEARQRVEAERSKLVRLGAVVTVDPAAATLGKWAVAFRLVTLLGLPLWLELAAPAVLAYGFAPAPVRAPVAEATKGRVRRMGKAGKGRASHRKAPPTTPHRRPTKGAGPRLVAANDA
jgi:hypothetical protein